MSISVKFASYSSEEVKRVIDHYNQIKPSHSNIIEELDRCEGGFQIAVVEEAGDTNQRIKQLRWNKRKLDPMNHRGFTQEETLRLYQSLVHVFGETSVSYENSTQYISNPMV